MIHEFDDSLVEHGEVFMTEDMVANLIEERNRLRKALEVFANEENWTGVYDDRCLCRKEAWDCLDMNPWEFARKALGLDGDDGRHQPADS